MLALIEKDIEFNRQYAARRLAGKLLEYKNSSAVIVSVPKGGVPVAFDMAQILCLPLELKLCRRIQHPAIQDESLGSVSIDETIINEQTRKIPQDYIYHQTMMIRNDLKTAYAFYCGNHEPMSLRNRVVILVDDFLKSGETLLAGLKSVRKQNPAKIIVALLVATQSGIDQIAPYADELIILTTVDDPFALEEIQRNLPTVTRDDVRDLFRKAHALSQPN
ncbi:MAG TPA: phosphoribosyltransferase family protein [Cyclobacteriaceae bacterium]|nr:phosphoribosyltransferase family protein [Cyclobacteriaceae bacterium]